VGFIHKHKAKQHRRDAATWCGDVRRRHCVGGAPVNFGPKKSALACAALVAKNVFQRLPKNFVLS